MYKEQFGSGVSKINPRVKNKTLRLYLFEAKQV